jgi:carboxypeptidase D
MEGLDEAMEMQRAQLERLREFMGPVQDTSPPVAKRQSTISFSNPAAEQFFVDGSSIPEGGFSHHYY